MVEPKKTETKLQIAISFDTTGSMYPCLKEVKRNLEYLLKKLFDDIEGIEVAIIAHGDYCDKDNLYKCIDFTNDQDILTNFINNVPSTGGGDTPEAYEYVLFKSKGLKWNVDVRDKLLIVIGDACPHQKGETNCGIKVQYDYKDEATMLKELGISIFSIHCLPFTDKKDKIVEKFMREISKITNGLYIQLDQFSYIVDLLIAMAYRQSGQDKFALYESYVRNNRNYNKQVQRMFDAINPNPFKREEEDDIEEENKEVRECAPSRFQVLKVENDCSIKQFVQEMGLVFKVGRGFYEHTKSEKISENKEIILMDRKTGRFYEGKDAEYIAGIEKGKKNNNKHNEDYIIFIQSTSYNRKLIGGTQFLYDAAI